MARWVIQCAIAVSLVAAFPARAGAMVLPETPETEVEISIFDLVGKAGRRKPASPRLPADYGKQVAQLIEAARPELTGCLQAPLDAVPIYQTSLRIDPRGSGEARITTEKDGKSAVEGGPADCVRRILSGIHYPKHPLTHPVVVKFPLILQRRNL